MEATACTDHAAGQFRKWNPLALVTAAVLTIEWLVVFLVTIFALAFAASPDKWEEEGWTSADESMRFIDWIDAGSFTLILLGLLIPSVAVFVNLIGRDRWRPSIAVIRCRLATIAANVGFAVWWLISIGLPSPTRDDFEMAAIFLAVAGLIAAVEYVRRRVAPQPS